MKSHPIQLTALSQLERMKVFDCLTVRIIEFVNSDATRQLCNSWFFEGYKHNRKTRKAETMATF